VTCDRSRFSPGTLVSPIRHLRLCEKCGIVDDEAHFFFGTIKDRLRTTFLDGFLYPCRINTLNDIDKIENILNPTSSQQVKSLSSFIKRSHWNWGQGALDYICYIVKQPFCLFVYDNCCLYMCLIHFLFICSLWSYIGCKLC
jgi:hypothetical protein